jgi:hypothetical protein
VEVRACDVARNVAVSAASFSIDAPSPSAIESPPTQICSGCAAVGVRRGGIVVVVGAGTVVVGGRGGGTAIDSPPARKASGDVDVVGPGSVIDGDGAVVAVVAGTAASGAGAGGTLWRMSSTSRLGRSRARAELTSPAASARLTATSRWRPNGKRSAMCSSDRALSSAAPP